MSLVKKVTSAVAALAIVFSIVSPISWVNAAYEGLEAANKLATLWVIVDQSANPADYRLGDTITRREMLKVMMKLSSTVTVVDNCEGKFADLPASDWGCKYAETALANNMIAANSNFRPDENVSKIEALKMIFKARGIEREENEDWKAGYVNTAVSKWITSTFSDYDTAAERQWIFVAAVEAADMDTVVEDDEDDLLGDLLGDLDDDEDDTDEDTTDEDDTDEDTTVTSDSVLTVSLSPSTPAAQNIPKSAANVEFLTFDVTAGSEDSTIETVKIQRVDLGSRSNFSKVWISQDGVVISNDKTISSDDTVTIALNVTVKAGETETYTVNASMNSPVGTTVNAFEIVEIVASTDVEGSDLRGNSMTTVAYTVAQVTLTPKGTASNIDAGEEMETLGEFKLSETASASKKDVIVKSIRFKTTWGVNVSDNLENMALYEDGTQVSTETVIDGDYVTFKLDDYVISDAKSAYFEIKADVVSGDDNDTIAFSVKDTFDIYAIEEGTAIGADVVKGWSLSIYTLNAGKITLSQDTSTPSSEEYISDTDEVLAFVAKVDSDQEVLVDSLRLFLDASSTITDTATEASADAIADQLDDLDAAVENVRVFVNDSLVDSVDQMTNASSSTVRDELISYANDYYNFDSSFTLNDDDVIKVYVDLTADIAANTQLKFKLSNAGTSAGNSLSLKDVEYVSDGETLVQAKLTGNATSNVVEVVSASAGTSIVRNDGFSTETFLAGEQGAVLMKFVVNAGNSSSLEIKKLNFDATNIGGGAYTDFTNFKLLKDGSQVGWTEDLGSGNSFTITDINTVVPQGEQATFELIGDIDTSTASNGLTVNLDSDDSVFYDSNDNEVLDWANEADVAGDASVVKSNAILAVSVDGDTADSAIVLADTSSVEIAKYKFTATDGDINLKDLYFRNINLGADSRISALKLVVDGSVVDSRVPSSDVIHFDLGSASKIVVPKNDDVVVTVEADFNSITTAAQTNKQIVLELTDVKADTAATSKALTVVNGAVAIDNGDHYTTSALAASDVQGERMFIRKTQPTIATQDLGTTKLVNGEQSIFKFTVSADSAEDVEVAQISFDVVDSATAITGGTYKLFINWTDKTADGVFAAGVFTFAANENSVVAAGSSKTYELKATLAWVVSDDYVSVKLIEDAADLSAGVEDKANATTDANAVFIWSDNAASPHTDATVDYFNGLNVNGLDTTTTTLTN